MGDLPGRDYALMEATASASWTAGTKDLAIPIHGNQMVKMDLPCSLTKPVPVAEYELFEASEPLMDYRLRRFT